MKSMETIKVIELDVEDIRGSEYIHSSEEEMKISIRREKINKRLINLFTKVGSRSKTKAPLYRGNLSVEKLFDSFTTLDKYIDYEDGEDEYKVNAVTRVRGYTTLWWN